MHKTVLSLPAYKTRSVLQYLILNIRSYCRLISDAPPVVTYSATPKSLLNQKSALPDANSEAPAKKKPKLEYIPMPTILTPRYVPTTKKLVEETKSSSNIETNTKNLPKDNVTKDKDSVDSVQIESDKIPEESIISDPKEEEQTQQNTESDATQKVSVQKVDVAEVNTEKPDRCDTDTKHSTSKVSDKVSSNCVNQSTSENRKHKKDNQDRRKDSSERKDSDRKSSTSSKSDRKPSTHSQKDDKSRSRSDKEKSRDRERSRSKYRESSKDLDKKVEKDKNKTDTEDRNKLSRDTERVDKDKHKKSDKDRDRKTERDKDRNKSSQSHRSSHSSKRSDSKGSKSDKTVPRSSSSTSSASHSRKKSSSTTSTSGKPKVELADKIYRDLLNNPPSDIDVESDEDEVMKQCRMIFEEYNEESGTPAVEKDQETVQTESNDGELIDIFADKYYDENRKKRVAREQAVASKAANVTSAPTRKPNHVQNAMKVR